jgi:Domain of unknown function (DUF4336)
LDIETMADKLIPKNPSACSVIRSVTPNIVTVSAPFLRFGLFKVGGRGTIVRMRSGALAVFSPTALTPEVRAELDRLGGNVRYIAATDIEHHIFLSEWAKAFPQANVLGPEGLPEKRQQMPEHKDTKFSHVWTADNKASFKVDEDFERDFDHEFVHAHGNKELVFNYKPERTLIQADLIFNLPATEQYSKTNEDASSGFLTKLFIGLMNTSGEAMMQRRFIWYAAGSKDRTAFSESMKRIQGWDFDRMIPCHGDVIETGGKGVFEKVMSWYLQGQK